MSSSRLVRAAHLFSCFKVPLHQAAPFSSRHWIGAVGFSRYSSFVGPSNDSRTFRSKCRDLVSKHGHHLMNCSLQDPCCSNIGRRFLVHASVEKKCKKMLFYLTGVVFALVGCAYAAVPLYRRFCSATGIYGTVPSRESVEEKIARHVKDGAVTSREVTVQFNADVADGMPWKFIPTQREVKVKTGESALAFYTAENRSSSPITGISTYNVTPMKAAVYFNKIQCFCFEQQRLLPGEQIDMPVHSMLLLEEQILSRFRIVQPSHGDHFSSQSVLYTCSNSYHGNNLSRPSNYGNRRDGCLSASTVDRTPSSNGPKSSSYHWPYFHGSYMVLLLLR